MRESAPWFKCYPAVLLTDSRCEEMTDEAFGVYVRLLCRAWLEGGITSDLRAIAKRLHKPWPQFEKVWPQIQMCWAPHPSDPGMLVNPRQEKERAEKNEKRERRSAAGSHGNAIRWRSQCDRNAITASSHCDYTGEKEKRDERREEKSMGATAPMPSAPPPAVSSVTKSPRKPRKAPGSPPALPDLAPALDVYREAFRAATGSAATEGAILTATVRDLVRQHGLEVFRAKVQKCYGQRQPAWLWRDRASGAATVPDVRSFARHFDAVLISALPPKARPPAPPPPAEPESPFGETMAEVRARQDRVRAELEREGKIMPQSVPTNGAAKPSLPRGAAPPEDFDAMFG